MLKRWKKLARHETYTAIMNTGIAWGAIVAVLVYFTSEKDRILVGGLFTLVFWLVTTVYFSLDYRKTHKKRKPKITFPPLAPQSSEPAKPVKSVSHRRWVFIKNLLFFVIEVFEASFCLGIIIYWNVVTVGENNIPVLTYQNGILIGFFIIGVFIVIDLVRRLRNPKETFFD